MFKSLGKIFRSSWKSFFKQGGLSFATCFILVMTILLATSIFLLIDMTQFMISNLQERVDISVYFAEDSFESDIMEIKDAISEIPEVKSVEYVSREAALENFMLAHQNDIVLIESINEIGMNPFLASLNIKAWDFAQYEKVSGYLTEIQSDGLVEKVDYFQRKPIIDRISSLTSGLKNAGIIISIILAIVAVLIVFNTIRLAILNQKEEISIQRLVGASNWFIRGPFFMQGIISGVIAFLVSFSLFALVCWILSPKIEVLFSDLNIFNLFVQQFWYFFAIQLATGIILGVVPSLVAIRRYLKV